jgi:hypothetical protein
MFARPATPDEMKLARRVVAAGGASGWVDLAHVLLCSNEFVYLD